MLSDGVNDFIVFPTGFLYRKEGFVFPRDQDVANATLGEGNRRTAGRRCRRTGTVLAVHRDESLGLGFVVAEFVQRIAPRGQIVPTRPAVLVFGLGVTTATSARLYQIVPNP